MFPHPTLTERVENGDVAELARILLRTRSIHQQTVDFVSAPVRMAVLPDELAERLGLTSFRAARIAKVLPELRGRVLDVGAGDNLLLKCYRRLSAELGCPRTKAEESVGVDVVDWGANCLTIRSSALLPFGDAEFDTVSFVASLNHIPERREALAEARRVLRPDGRLVVTMIGRLIGRVGHAIWWYSEDKHRPTQPGETGGLDREEVQELLRDAGFSVTATSSFVYRLNHLYVARPI